MNEFDYGSLDPGIRSTVKWLHSHGFETTDSGDGSKAGEMEGALDIPHVAIKTPHDRVILARNTPDKVQYQRCWHRRTADWLLNCLMGAGVEVRHGDIQLTYDPKDESFVLMFFGTVPGSKWDQWL